MRTLVAGLVCALALSGCTSSDDIPVVAPSPAPPAGSSPSPSDSPTQVFDTWVVGAKPLPVGRDGFGIAGATPPELRERRLVTLDLLPPPTDGEFAFRITRVSPAFVRRTDLAWRKGCPVGLSRLRYLRMSFWGFDDRPHTGEMVVHARVAHDVVDTFRRMYDAKFPLEQMRLITEADLVAPPTGDGNVTSAYVCRPTTGATTTWSAHAYGLAIDVNPFDNPYQRGDLVLPELARAYLDRSWVRPGMIFPGDLVTREFDRIGWTWGGDFQSLKDYQHFSANGR